MAATPKRTPSSPAVFVRDATGLTKQTGVLDIFVFNTNNQNIGLGVLFLIAMIGSYPGANTTLAIILTALLCIPVAAVYAMFSGTMPRSGGDYVYVSRVLGPRLGFISSFNWLFWLLVYLGMPAAFLSQYGLSPLLRLWGALSGSSSLVDLGNSIYTPTGTIIAGSILILVFAGIFTMGTGLYMRLQNWTFALAMLSLVLMAIVGFTSSPETFKAGFDKFIVGAGGKPGAYAAIMAEAAKAGPDPGFSWESTGFLMAWAILILLFSITSSFIGGEVKSARNTQMVGMVGSVVFTAVCLVALVAAFASAVGAPFLSALGAVKPEVYGLDFAPGVLELAGVAAGSTFMAILIGVLFLFWTYVWLPINFLASTRALLAWSFDRLVPESVAYVSPRFHTPVVSITIVAVLGFISLVLYALGVLSTLAGIFGWAVSFVITAVAAIVFPYKSADLFEASPFNSRIAGIPVFTVTGVLALVGLGVMEYILWYDPVAGLGADSPASALMRWISLGVLAGGWVLYELISLAQRSKGIDVSAAFKEIPPE